MNTPARFLRPTSPAAIVLAVVVLVVAAGGIGYSAGQVDTNDIKNNAVTSAKVKNGQISNADLVKEKKYVKITAPGQPDYLNGGEGDCVWQDGSLIFPGIAKASIQRDRFGMVHLAGIAVATDGPGGDADCDSSDVGETEDGILMFLPKSYRPERTQIVSSALTSSPVIIVGNQALVSGPIVLPPGAVYASGGGAQLDGVEYYPAGSKVAAKGTTTTKLTPAGKALLHRLGVL